MGRKNFLFVGDNDAGHNLAILQTIVATCQASRVNPEAYIADVLLRVGTTAAADIDSLLHANWKPIAMVRDKLASLEGEAELAFIAERLTAA